MNKLYIRVYLIFFLSFSLIFNGYSQFFKKLTDAVGSVANVAINTVKAPIQTVTNAANVVVGGGSVADIYKPYQEIAKTTGNTVENLSGLANQPQQELYKKAQEFTSSNLGKTGEFVFDVGTFHNRFINEMGNSSAQSAANILKGENPFAVFAAPLAAAIRSARENHITKSYPLPKEIINALSPYFSQNTLSRARYTVGNVEITLPNFIGKGHGFMREDYAVVVDDVIVFNTPPPSFNNGAFWWIHEITHIEQYEKLGIETFAFTYLKDLGKKIENEADTKANSFTTKPKTPSNLSSIVQEEKFIAQCIFPEDEFNVTYLISTSGKIYAIDPLSGQYIHIGYVQPANIEGAAWNYKTEKLQYAVTNKGQICSIIDNKWVQVGKVRLI